MRQQKVSTRATIGTPPAAALKDASDQLNPRKLPRQERAAATVVAILEAAARILETKGVEAYTTNAIAELAGASIGSLYQYFPNKAALTNALITREEKVLLSHLTTLLDRPGGSALLRDLIAVAVEHQLRRPVLARLLDAEESRLPPREDAGQLEAALMAIFRRCLGDELIAAEPQVPQDLFAIIYGMVDVAGQRGESDRDALARRVERAVWGYLHTCGHPIP